ncbi:hypothetical protein [Aeromicrobium sp. P5_D10]
MADKDPLRGIFNSPSFQVVARSQRLASQVVQQQAEHRRKMDELTDAVGSAQREKVKRERSTAESTAEVAAWAREQSEENRRLRYLTNVLAFAVIYDVVSGTFDNHTWWTTVISVTVGVAVLGGALLLGKWHHRKQVAAAAANNVS